MFTATAMLCGLIVYTALVGCFFNYSILYIVAIQLGPK